MTGTMATAVTTSTICTIFWRADQVEREKHHTHELESRYLVIVQLVVLRQGAKVEEHVDHHGEDEGQVGNFRVGPAARPLKHARQCR